MESATEYQHSKDGGILVRVSVEKDVSYVRCIYIGPRRPASALKKEVKRKKKRLLKN